MAGAFDDFTPPTAGPLADFTPPAPQPVKKGYVPGQIAGVQIPGLATLDNATRVAQDAMTFGGADAATGGTARADTQAARDALGPVGSGLADVAGYATGPGEIGVGAGLTKLMGGRLAARMAGGAAEGAGAAALGTAGHGDTDLGDIGKSAAIGGAIGGVTGGLPVSRETPPSPSTADLENAAHNAWKLTGNVSVNPVDVGNALAQAHLALTPGERVLMAGETNAAVARAMRESAQSNSLTANDVKKFQDAIMGSTRDPQELRVAGQFRDSLDNAYGPTKTMVDAANTATSRAKTADEIDQWLADPKSAPKAVAGALAKNPGFYAHIASPLASVASMANPTLGQTIGHEALNAGVGAAVGGGIGYMTGGNPIGDAALGAVGGAARGRMTSAIKNAPIKQGLLAAKHMNATGQELPASAFAQWPRGVTIPSDLLRKSGYAAGATGAY